MIRIPGTFLLAFVLLVAWLAPVVHAQSGTVERIEVPGLRRMSREAFLHALQVKEGDAYDPDKLRERFRALWDLGLFEDIVIEAEDGPGGGKVVVVKVVERPVLSSVTYGDNKVLTRTQIEDYLQENDIRLRLGKPLDMKSVADAEAGIRDLLGQKGFLDGKVESEVREVTTTSKAVHFRILPGGKTRIRGIEFIGNALFSDRRLKKELKLTEERRWYWPWSQKNLYHPLKWDQDVGNIRDLYLNHGYLDVEIKAPVIEVRETRKEPKKPPEPEQATEPAADSGPSQGQLAAMTTDQRRKIVRQQQKRRDKQRRKEEKARRKSEPKIKKQIFLSVPVTEGQFYTAGEITIEGNEVLSDADVMALIPLRKGMVLRSGLLDLGIDAVTRRYEDRGHLYASVVRQITRHPDERVADVRIDIDEDEPYYISAIEFAGNTTTQDKVLRREVLVSEGELFHRTRLDVSKVKVNQLGYFQVEEDPVIEPVEGENRVRITMLGEERGRNEIQIGGGYSGLDGAFFTGVYSTRNFLGRGQIVSVALQVGGRSSRYQLSFQEPWFLNRPYTLGFSLFRTDIDYGGTLQSTSQGGGVLIGKQLRPFMAARVGYSFESATSTAFNVTGNTFDTATNRISSLTPSFTFDNVNNPYRPSSGTQFTLSFQVAGGPLGGDTSFLKPIARYTTYRRKWTPGRSFMAVHAEVGMVREWSDGTVLNSASINGIPRFQRFWLGGDTIGPRVFETRTITPLRYVAFDSTTNSITGVTSNPSFLPIGSLITSGGVPALVEVGGDRFYLLQTEMVFPLNQQADVALFLDAGDALSEDQSWGLDTTRIAAGIELRFHLPVFPVPLRLIYGWPIRSLQFDRTSRFTFSIGRSF